MEILKMKTVALLTTVLFMSSGHIPIKKSKDISGVAINDKGQVLLVDDGGNDGKSEIFLAESWPIDGKKVKALKVSQKLQDLEAATSDGKAFYFISSLSFQKNDEKNVLVKYDLASDKWDFVNMRNALLNSLDKYDSIWAKEIPKKDAKAGGLNVEGLSIGPEGKLLLGLRSPLTKDKKALIATLGKESHYPIETLTPVDLEGHGIRGMEYIPSLKKYILISGPVEKGEGHRLWQWSPPDHLKELKSEEFTKLCRPESVIPLKKGFAIISESSGKECKKSIYDYIVLELTP